MRKKILIIILMLVINIMFLNINIVQAENITDIFTEGDSFLEAGKSTTINEIELQNASQTIYNMLLVLGICVAVVIAAILGIKFMIGSAEEKAQVKDELVPFVIGCVVVFGAFGFWKIFVTIGNYVSDDWETQKVSDYVETDEKLYEKEKLYCKICNEKLYESDIQNRSDGRYIMCSKCHNSYKIECNICQKKLTYDEIVKGKCNGEHGIGSHSISDSIMKNFIIYK